MWKSTVDGLWNGVEKPRWFVEKAGTVGKNSLYAAATLILHSKSNVKIRTQSERFCKRVIRTLFQRQFHSDVAPQKAELFVESMRFFAVTVTRKLHSDAAR